MKISKIVILFIGFLSFSSVQVSAQGTSNAAMVFFWAEDIERPGPSSWKPLGSGFLVSDQGVILTARHVVTSVVTGQRVVASISDKSMFPVPIDETDILCAMANRDVCAVRVPPGSVPNSVDKVFNLECGPLPVRTQLRAMGFTGGADRFGGVIEPGGEVVGSAMRGGLIPTDLDLVPTMSGGPVLNDRGNVVALAKGADRTSPNLTFVTPIIGIKPVLESLNVECSRHSPETRQSGSVGEGEQNLTVIERFSDKFKPNRIEIGPPRVLTSTGLVSNCAVDSGIVSAQEGYSFVSSNAKQSCTNYVHGRYRPFDPDLSPGERIRYRIIVERSGTTPNDGGGDFKEYTDSGQLLGRPFPSLDDIPETVFLHNDHVYFFELNTQVNFHRSPGTNRISIRFERLRTPSVDGDPLRISDIESLIERLKADSEPGYLARPNPNKGISRDHRLTLRMGPGQSFPALNMLTPDDRLIAYAVQGKWLLVELQETGVIGFVHSDFIEKVSVTAQTKSELEAMLKSLNSDIPVGTANGVVWVNRAYLDEVVAVINVLAKDDELIELLEAVRGAISQAARQDDAGRIIEYNGSIRAALAGLRAIVSVRVSSAMD